MKESIIEKEKIKEIEKKLLNEDTIINISELFKVFGDTTRVKIINILLENRLCVGDIAYLIKSTPSAVSHQLRILKSAKLVKYQKIGKVVYYEVSDNHVKTLFNIGKEHIDEI
ncbi:MAG: winged helix-turn-helix transcriptional regulator [Bacilli bacterium]|nr:winged helix-turn-helix transcriptional regulator [Bacilli bacterium]